MNKTRPFSVVLLSLLLPACSPEHEVQIDRLADFYVQRQLDTLPADSGVVSELGGEYDLPALDSVTSAWTADEWVRFWERVEEKRLSVSSP